MARSGQTLFRAGEALYNKVEREGSNCRGKEDEFLSEKLPSDIEARVKCYGCPALVECDTYQKIARNRWGVWGGKVYGRES